MPSCLFRFPLCAQSPSMAPHQGIRDWVKPGPGLGESVQVAAQEGRGHHQKPGCWVTTLPAAHFLQPGQGPQKALLWRSHHQPWAERTLAGSAWSRHPPPPPLCPLACWQCYRCPRGWKTSKPGTNPVFPRGSAPGNREAKEWGSLWSSVASGCDLTIDISGGTLQREAQWASSKNSPHDGSGFHMCL